MLLHFGHVPIILVSSAEVASNVMKTHDVKFANRPKTKMVDILLNGGRDLVFSPYGEYWRQMKSICVQNLLNSKTVRSFENIREDEVNVMMEKLEKASSSSSTVNLSELISDLTNDVITRIVFGRKYSFEEGSEISRSILRKFMELFGAFPLGEYIPSLAWIDRVRGLDNKVKEVNNQIDGFLERVVQEHEDADKFKSSFFSILLMVQRDKTAQFELDRSGLKIMLFDMFLGGSATTFTLLEWTMTELMRHPECMKKLQDEIRLVPRRSLYVLEKEVEKMNYLHVVIKEVLRLHPPAPLLPRLLSEDVKLHGYDIATGTQVLINLWTIQRDTKTWGADAEEFRPERHLDSPLDFQGQNFSFIPFGSGRRGCPGIDFALGLVEVTLANLVNRFEWRVKGGGKPDVFEATGIEVCRKFPLIVCPSSTLFSM
ncbi:PREDICTED: cytochrome P450 71A20-like isoform X1 [Camelina sativa]|uniref:Cytochrome P450 71A20-like isoform X1 n=1 Tax=Camelina sativa TaxID=90675 RepID=A0ABM0T6Y0_CAMSA|nr:PREDICTED: cytochrome P450 71A20-like isoform X2 [Camelina sativa]XP_019084747.1 PREDICTED: cytochrome P450 71A20-like isoform X1 [Camelina sativa]